MEKPMYYLYNFLSLILIIVGFLAIGLVIITAFMTTRIDKTAKGKLAVKSGWKWKHR